MSIEPTGAGSGGGKVLPAAESWAASPIKQADLSSLPAIEGEDTPKVQKANKRREPLSARERYILGQIRSGIPMAQAIYKASKKRFIGG